MSNSLLRILTALIGIPAVVGLLYLGGWPFGVLVLAVALVAQLEVYQLFEAVGIKSFKTGGLLLGALLVLRVLMPDVIYAAIGLVVVLVALSPFERRTDRKDETTMWAGPSTHAASLATTIFGAVYPAAMLAFLLDLRLARGPAVDDAAAFMLALAVILLVWASDTFAYYTGRAVGKRPLAPTISPKKTWEGAVGGAVGALFVAAVLKVTVLDVLPWVHVAGVAIICGAFGQVGDLAESKLKRLADVKDSGTLLPGHGGMLDRFDAMIVVAPAVYLYLRFVAGVLY